MSEFAPICIYLVISPLVSLIPLGVPFPFASNSSTYLEKLSAYECGSDPSGDARSRFDIRFYPVPILFIIPDPEVTFSLFGARWGTHAMVGFPIPVHLGNILGGQQCDPGSGPGGKPSGRRTFDGQSRKTTSDGSGGGIHTRGAQEKGSNRILGFTPSTSINGGFYRGAR